MSVCKRDRSRFLLLLWHAHTQKGQHPVGRTTRRVLAHITPKLTPINTIPLPTKPFPKDMPAHAHVSIHPSSGDSRSQTCIWEGLGRLVEMIDSSGLGSDVGECPYGVVREVVLATHGRQLPW